MIENPDDNEIFFKNCHYYFCSQISVAFSAWERKGKKKIGLNIPF